ncbi:aa3-type cytochrome c oxidase subunit IV [Falsiroseomonas sp. HC035]|uniref:aa3-type cytochrome c oxidase subunit IV n=1 Tax=Falsiroseomonas sp. HC035 TaxID=3390999 RepID=UPI003D31137D
MAEQAPTYEMVEVKAEDILAERQSFYGAFMKGTVWSIGITVVILLLMAIFLV